MTLPLNYTPNDLVAARIPCGRRSPNPACTTCFVLFRDKSPSLSFARRPQASSKSATRAPANPAADVDPLAVRAFLERRIAAHRASPTPALILVIPRVKPRAHGWHYARTRVPSSPEDTADRCELVRDNSEEILVGEQAPAFPLARPGATTSRHASRLRPARGSDAAQRPRSLLQLSLDLPPRTPTSSPLPRMLVAEAPASHRPIPARVWCGLSAPEPRPVAISVQGGASRRWRNVFSSPSVVFEAGFPVKARHVPLLHLGRSFPVAAQVSHSEGRHYPPARRVRPRSAVPRARFLQLARSSSLAPLSFWGAAPGHRAAGCRRACESPKTSRYPASFGLRESLVVVRPLPAFPACAAGWRSRKRRMRKAGVYVGARPICLQEMAAGAG
ncbi:hypothetical protein C8R47DRAFT_1226154 [Mycena vitilis]|nr:hypothetical protein C8R47DRAFT_1226154 [Mycena vitilis]